MLSGGMYMSSYETAIVKELDKALAHLKIIINEL